MTMYRHDELSQLKNQVTRLTDELTSREAQLNDLTVQNQDLRNKLSTRPPREGFFDEVREWWGNRKRKRRRRFRSHTIRLAPIALFLLGAVVITSIVFGLTQCEYNPVNEGYVTYRDYVPERTTRSYNHNTEQWETKREPEEFNVRVCGERGCVTIDNESYFRSPEWAVGTYHCLRAPCSGPLDEGTRR